MKKELIKNSMFKAKILGKVYFVWFFRRIVPLVLVQVAVAVFVIKIFAKNVFVSKVLHNVAIVSDSGYWEIFKYLINSFMATHFIIQLAILITLGLTALLIRDIVRAIFVYFVTMRQKNRDQG
ncbi:MAG: hypothetical protein PHN74_03205 [Candidatus Pacebacteria bacterium]|nr:hypothetical protein [Candidatus Paceibacterota bacterium]